MRPASTRDGSFWNYRSLLAAFSARDPQFRTAEFGIARRVKRLHGLVARRVGCKAGPLCTRVVARIAGAQRSAIGTVETIAPEFDLGAFDALLQIGGLHSRSEIAVNRRGARLCTRFKCRRDRVSRDPGGRSLTCGTHGSSTPRKP